MIVELTQFPVAPENRDAFEKGWLQAAAILVRQPGYLSHRIGSTVEQPDVFVLEIEWESLEAHTERFVNDPSFGEFLGCFAPYLSGEASVMHFRP
ncbi:antibiotic biosynthesis monooxygenase family protein [Hansschlegelia quercus]|uniref:Antibiotic biosynthesis monooxygenase n=1 Tax=Hansschlegelia quercus TaxID=2528245 RepID=A0A4Q9GP02_9HYPH|nr:antibiotic biosynthesis monooxygenase family protein [Hansschlegelia quercus]TBN53590.1 antibiotic biosynthesis monooxygenase [Hansschlegelia quercus]